MTTTPPSSLPPGHSFTAVIELMNRLLAPDGGCPWDREQTLSSLRPFLLEEAHEVLEALEAGDVAGHREELGDLLFQVVFQSALREREGAFTIDDVCQLLVDKMVRRHPHVFGDAQVKDAADQLRAWQELKKQEKKAAGKVGRTLDGVPVALPALLRAARLGDKAAGIGFDWPDVAGVRQKLDEELGELDEAMAAGDPAQISHELGDLLFTITRLASKLGVGPEDALRQANARFSRRFNAMEDRVHAAGATLKGLSLDEMNGYWEQAKRDEAARAPQPSDAVAKP